MQQKSLGLVDADLAHALKNLWPIDELGDILDTDYTRHIDETAHRGVVLRVGV